MLFWWKGRDFIGFLKSRVTYPRTGYVQPPEEFEGRTGAPFFARTWGTLISLSLSPGPPADENVTYFMTRTVMVIFFILFPLFGPGLPARWIAPLFIFALAVMLYVLNRSLERPFRWW